MSPFTELVGMLGEENLQGVITIIVTALFGKVSWDSYNSKNLVNRSEIEEQVKKIKEEIRSEFESSSSTLREEIKEVKLKFEEAKKVAVSEMREDVKKAAAKIEKAVDLVQNVEVKFKSLEERTASAASKIEDMFNNTDRPRISRAEIRRMKEKGN